MRQMGLSGFGSEIEADIEVLIEGDAAWVENMREELGIWRWSWL